MRHTLFIAILLCLSITAHTQVSPFEVDSPAGSGLPKLFEVKSDGTLLNLGNPIGQGAPPQNLSLGGANNNELTISDGNTVVLPVSGGLDEKANFSSRPFPSSPTSTIATDYPSLTNSDIQTLTGNPTATTSDYATWFYLQEVFHAKRANFYNIGSLEKIVVPQGETYTVSQPLVIDYGGHIDFTGTQLRAASGYSGYTVRLVSQWGFGTYKGLFIDGNYTAGGLWLDFQYADMINSLNTLNHWQFQNLHIQRATVGLNMGDTYYGSITGHSVITDCLTGINMFDAYPNGWYGNSGPSAEVNTINFRGLDLNGPSSAALSQFGVATNYQSKAWDIGVTTLNVGFTGITMENWHTAIHVSDTTDSGVPNKLPKMVWEKNYFEGISGHIFNHEYTQAGSAVEMVFSNNHVNFSGLNGTIPLVLPVGSFKIENNNFTSRSLDYLIDANNSITWKNTVLITDIQPYHIKDSRAAAGRLLIKHSMAFDADARSRFNVENYVAVGASTGNNPPAREVLPHWSVDQDKVTTVYPYPLSDVPTQHVELQTATNTSLRDIAFPEAGTGIILKDETLGTFRRLVLRNGSLVLEEENLKGRVYNYERSMNINYFLNLSTPASQSEKWYGKAFHYSLMKWNGSNWIQTVGGSWDIVCIGTTAQRPTSRPTGFVYYDTNLNNFYVWNGGWALANDPANDIIISNH